jgi:hypothetical protein
VTLGLPEVSGVRLKRALERTGFVEINTRGSHCKPRHLGQTLRGGSRGGSGWWLGGLEVARLVEAEAELFGAVGVGPEHDPADVLVGDEQEGEAVRLVLVLDDLEADPGGGGGEARRTTHTVRRRSKRKLRES